MAQGVITDFDALREGASPRAHAFWLAAEVY